jgi:ABC-type branched-subunit amino acid transport system permease subunit
MNSFGRLVPKNRTYYHALLIKAVMLLMFMKRFKSLPIGFAWSSIREKAFRWFGVLKFPITTLFTFQYPPSLPLLALP